MEKTFSIFHQNFVMDDGRALDVKIRRRVMACADEYCEKLRKQYIQHTKEFLEDPEDAMSTLLQNAAVDCVAEMLAIGLPLITEGDILAWHAPRYDFYSFDALDKIEISKDGRPNQKTYDVLASALHMDIFDYIYPIEEKVAEKMESFRPISIKDEQNSVYLFTALQKVEKGSALEYELAYKLFETDPAESEYYGYCIEHFPEERKELIALAEYCGVDISATISSQNFKQDEKKRSDRKKYAQDLREQLFNLSNVSYEKIEQYVLEQNQIYTETKEKLEEAEKIAVLNNSVWARYKSAQKKAGVISCVAIVIGVVGILFANLIVFAVGVVGLLTSYLYASKVLHLNDLATEAQKCAPRGG